MNLIKETLMNIRRKLSLNNIEVQEDFLELFLNHKMSRKNYQDLRNISSNNPDLSILKITQANMGKDHIKFESLPRSISDLYFCDCKGDVDVLKVRKNRSIVGLHFYNTSFINLDSFSRLKNFTLAPSIPLEEKDIKGLWEQLKKASFKKDDEYTLEYLSLKNISVSSILVSTEFLDLDYQNASLPDKISFKANTLLLTGPTSEDGTYQNFPDLISPPCDSIYCKGLKVKAEQIFRYASHRFIIAKNSEIEGFKTPSEPVMTTVVGKNHTYQKRGKIIYFPQS